MFAARSIWMRVVAFWVLFQFVWAQEAGLKEAKTSKDGIISLTDYNFQQVFNIPEVRSFGIAVLFTTHAVEFGCATCTKFDPEFDLIASSWAIDHPDFTSNQDPDVKLLFAKAVIESPSEIPNIFKIFKLQQIPKLLYFPPGSDIQNFETLDVPQEEGAERINQVISWLQGLTGVRDFSIHQPTDWVNIILTSFIAFSIVFLYRRHSNIFYKIIGSKWGWTLMSVVFIVFMVSGYMFTKMRQVPLAGTNRNGEIIYFAEREFQNQFAIETQIIGLFYGILCCLMIFLIKVVPALDNISATSDNKKLKKKTGIVNSPYLAYILAVAGAIVLYSFFAAYTNIYALKQSYPFTFFKITSLFKH